MTNVNPTYNEQNKVQFNTVYVPIPDGFKYVTKKYNSESDEDISELLSRYLLVAASGDLSGGWNGYTDAALGFNMTKAKQASMSLENWMALRDSAKADQYIKVELYGRDFSFRHVKDGDGYIVAYARGKECESSDEPYWVMYYILLILGAKEYNFNMYFNGDNAGEEYYCSVMEAFCSRIEIKRSDSGKGGENSGDSSLDQKTLMKYDEHLSFDLPEGYEVNLETNSDEETIYVIYSGVYIDDDGTKKATGRTRITTQKVEDLNYFEERAESDFDIRIGNYIREINHPFLNLIGLGGKVFIEHNGNCYGVYITKVSKEEELNENAEKIASELTDIINCMIIDGDIPNVKPIPATMIYKPESFDEFRIADPSENQHTHWDFLNGTQNALGLLGAFRINENGTEYEFISVSEMHFDESIEAIINKYSVTDYSLSNQAYKMSELFRVTPEAFDEGHDREQEIKHGLICKVALYERFRSFVWTLLAYCADNNIQPGEVEYEILDKMCWFIESRRDLNYSNRDFSPAICSGDDIHVYYLPSLLTEDKRILLKYFNEGGNDPEKECIVSLEDLRNELKYIYPAIQTIYKRLSAERNREEELEGGTADILYVWCSMTYAARRPVFSEDGPMRCSFSHPEKMDPNEARALRMIEELRKRQNAINKKEKNENKAGGRKNSGNTKSKENELRREVIKDWKSGKSISEREKVGNIVSVIEILNYEADPLSSTELAGEIGETIQRTAACLSTLCKHEICQKEKIGKVVRYSLKPEYRSRPTDDYYFWVGKERVEKDRTGLLSEVKDKLKKNSGNSFFSIMGDQINQGGSAQQFYECFMILEADGYAARKEETNEYIWEYIDKNAEAIKKLESEKEQLESGIQQYKHTYDILINTRSKLIEEAKSRVFDDGKYTAYIDELDQKKSVLSEKQSSLGFFKFSEKKQLNKEIEECAKTIEETRDALEKARQEFETEKSNLISKYEKEIDEAKCIYSSKVSNLQLIKDKIDELKA